MATAVLTAHDVPTTLNYYAPVPDTDESPYQYVYEPPAGKPKNNLSVDTHQVVIHDARGKDKEYDLSLDTSGFQFLEYPSKEKEFDDDERIKKEYYKEVEELLKTETGAKRVLIFDHTIRRKPEDQARKDVSPNSLLQLPAA